MLQRGAQGLGFNIMGGEDPDDGIFICMFKSTNSVSAVGIYFLFKKCVLSKSLLTKSAF